MQSIIEKENNFKQPGERYNYIAVIEPSWRQQNPLVRSDVLPFISSAKYSLSNLHAVKQ